MVRLARPVSVSSYQVAVGILSSWMQLDSVKVQRKKDEDQFYRKIKDMPTVQYVDVTVEHKPGATLKELCDILCVIRAERRRNCMRYSSMSIPEVTTHQTQYKGSGFLVMLY